MRVSYKYMVETLRLTSSSSPRKKYSHLLNFLVRLQVDYLEVDPDPRKRKCSCPLHTNTEGHRHWKGINQDLVHPSMDMLRHGMAPSMDMPRHRTVSTLLRTVLHRTVSTHHLIMVIGLRLLAPMVIRRLLPAMRRRPLIQVMAHRLQAATIMDLLQVARHLPAVMDLRQVTVVMDLRHRMDTEGRRHLLATANILAMVHHLLTAMARPLMATPHHLLGMPHMDIHLRMPLDILRLRIIMMIKAMVKAVKKARQEVSAVPGKSVWS